MDSPWKYRWLGTSATTPVAPVRKPGAMLRSMTRLAERGGLYLIGSLIGLKQRVIANAAGDQQP